MADLAAKHKSENILGHPCDVTQFEQVQQLWEASKNRFGQIDIWINNAGIAHQQFAFWQHSPEQIKATVETNLTGAMYGSKVALTEMLAQGFGSLYTMEGLGSNGRRVEGLTLYGTTKYGLRYLNQALAQETKNSPIVVGALSPGMVITDLITQQYQDRPEDFEKAKRIFTILADHVDTVTPWLAKKVLANTTSGARITWLTRGKIIRRFLASPFRKRDLFKNNVSG